MSQSQLSRFLSYTLYDSPPSSYSLHVHTDEDFFCYVKTLNPANIDFELRSLSMEDDFADLRMFLDAIQSRLKTKKDFELVQSYMNHFLKIHGDVVIANFSVLGDPIRAILTEHKKEWHRIEELLHYNLCLLDFFRK